MVKKGPVDALRLSQTCDRDELRCAFRMERPVKPDGCVIFGPLVVKGGERERARLAHSTHEP